MPFCMLHNQRPQYTFKHSNFLFFARGKKKKKTLEKAKGQYTVFKHTITVRAGGHRVLIM